MPAGTAAVLLARGLTRLQPVGLHPFLAPMAINSRPYQGRPACNNCGFCSGYGCPILARVGALAPLREALRAGAELRPESMVVKSRDERPQGDRRQLARSARTSGTPSPATSSFWPPTPSRRLRLACLSGLPDPHDLAGRRRHVPLVLRRIGHLLVGTPAQLPWPRPHP